MTKIITHELALTKINEKCKNKNYTLISFKYVKSIDKNLHLRCNIDGHEWITSYHSFINHNSNCRKCAGTLPLKQSNVEYEINEKCIKMNYTYQPFIYKNCDENNIKIKCNKDGYEWVTSYYKFIKQDTDCSKCSNRPIIIQQEAYNYVLNICFSKNYTLLEPFIYTNSKKTYIHLKCNKDNYDWYISYDNLMRGKNCPKCSNTPKITQHLAEITVLNKYVEKNYNLISPFIYTTAKKTHIHLKCNKCNHEWHPTYDSLINGNYGCPHCNISNGENLIEKILIENDMKFEQQKIFKDCKNIKILKFDFYLSDFNTCIEYDGIQHFKAFDFFGGKNTLEQNKKRDKIKNEYCKNNNIHLYRISYKDDIIVSLDYIIKNLTDHPNDKLNKMVF
jgi:hypothetical protein